MQNFNFFPRPLGEGRVFPPYFELSRVLEKEIRDQRWKLNILMVTGEKADQSLIGDGQVLNLTVGVVKLAKWSVSLSLQRVTKNL